MGKWISVKEKLPPVGEEVIVLSDTIHGNKVEGANCISFGHIVNKEGYIGIDIFTGKKTHRIPVDYGGWNIPGVHHWIPCPPVPGEDERRYIDEPRDHFANASKMDEPTVSKMEIVTNEDLEKAAEDYSNSLDYYHYTGDDPSIAFKAGAAWQKEQMMKEAIKCQIEDGDDYMRLKCLHTGCRPEDNGKAVNVIILKDDDNTCPRG